MKNQIIISCLFFLLSISVYSQKPEEKAFLTVRGGVSYFTNGKPMSGVTVNLYEKSSLIETITTNSEGNFNFKLNLNSEYYIEVSKQGHISKKIYYNTNIPDYEKAVLLSEFEFTLFSPCPSLDYSLYKDPVALVKYNKPAREFNVDREYEKRFMDNNEKLLMDHENCDENEYQKIVKKADEQFKTKNYNESRASYSEARQLKYDDKYVQNQIDEIDKILANQGNADKQFANIIQQADNYFKINNLSLAKELYKKAQSLKPTDSYATSKIQEIDRLLAQKNQAQQQQMTTETQYQQHLTAGNTALNSGNYSAAKQAYQQALTVKPGDAFATQKIAETDKLLNEKQKMSFQELAKKQLYDESIVEADALFAQNDLVNARASYLKANAILPEQQYPKQKMNEIDLKLKAQEQEKEKLYTTAMAEAERLFASKNYDQSKAQYQKALTLKPAEQYPRQKITEIDKLLADLKNQQAQQKAKLEQFNQTMAEADKLLAQGDLANAKLNYQKAIGIMPDQALPKQKITEVDNTIKAREQEKDKQYLTTIADADRAFAAKNYEQAKALYLQAASQKPNDIYPKNRIAETDKLLADQQKAMAQQKAQKDIYTQTMAEADKLLAQGDLINAKTAYNRAATIIPDQILPKQKIAEIDNTLKTREQEKDKQFMQFVQSADKAFTTKNLAQAKTDYENALKLKPTDAYTNQRIAEVNRLIAEQQQNLAKQKATDDAYNAAIQKANNLFNSKQLVAALQAYQEASTIKPAEQLPQSRIAEINNQLKQAETEKNFKDALAQADNYMKIKDFDNAQMAYQNALSIKPNDPYATQQKALAEKEIIGKIKQAADQKARKDAYDKSIIEAEKMLAAKDYENARATFLSASNLMPNEVYPKQKLAEVDKLLGNKKLQLDYQAAVVNGDNLLSQNKLDEAAAEYKKALALKANDQYASSKLKEIDQIRQKSALEQQDKAKKQQTYQQMIVKADDLFNKANYEMAKAEYEKAQLFMPEEVYPKQRINKIKDMLSLLAKDKAMQQQAQAKTTQKKVIEDLKFKDDSERERYLKDLLTKYPPGITLEVYKEEKRTVNRYIIVRENKAVDLREIRHSWGGVDYIRNDKPATSMYFNGQIKSREGEYFNKIEF